MTVVISSLSLGFAVIPFRITLGHTRRQGFSACLATENPSWIVRVNPTYYADLTLC